MSIINTRGAHGVNKPLSSESAHSSALSVGSLYVVRRHMLTIWTGPGMSEHCDWAIFGDPKVALTLSAVREGAEDRRLTVNRANAKAVGLGMAM